MLHYMTNEPPAQFLLFPVKTEELQNPQQMFPLFPKASQQDVRFSQEI